MEKDTAALIEALSDNDENTRFQAAEALGEIGEPAVQPILDKLASMGWMGQQAAAKALGIIKNPRAVEPLLSILQRQESALLIGVANALGEIGDSRAAEPLMGIVRGDFRIIDEMLSEALSMSLGPASASAAGELKRVATKVRQEVRNAAADAVGKITGKRPKVDACFIATAVMGDYEHPVVLELRHLRDDYLGRRKWGRAFIDAYYRCSPPLAQFISKSRLLRQLCYTLVVKPLEVVSRKLVPDVTSVHRRSNDNKE